MKSVPLFAVIMLSVWTATAHAEEKVKASSLGGGTIEFARDIKVPKFTAFLTFQDGKVVGRQYWNPKRSESKFIGSIDKNKPYCHLQIDQGDGKPLQPRKGTLLYISMVTSGAATWGANYQWDDNIYLSSDTRGYKAVTFVGCESDINSGGMTLDDLRKALGDGIKISPPKEEHSS